MATAFCIASGNNNAAGYARIEPQPAFTGIEYPREIFAGDGTAYDDGGAFVELVIAVMAPAQYALLLARAGFGASDKYKAVTVSLPDAARATWTDYNATAIRPRARQERRFDKLYYYEVTLRLREVVAI